MAKTRPEWLRSLTRAVRACLAGDEVGKFGFTCARCPERSGWTITVFPAPFEVIGGERDGSKVWESFSLDVDNLRRVFDQPPSTTWHSNRPDSPSSVRMAGCYRRRPVVVCVREEPPASVKPKGLLDWATQRVRPVTGSENGRDEPEGESP